MEKLNEILRELGISKVKLAKFLGVSRQMIYNYVELDDINKWPKDKKVLLLNLLGVKSTDDIMNIKVDTDYIMNVETRINSLFNNSLGTSGISETNTIFNGMSKKKTELLRNIIDLIKEKLDEDSEEGYTIVKYLYHYLQSIDNAKELKYILGYVSKATGFVKPLEFAFDEEQQFIFESIMYSAMTLYTNNGSASKAKLAESHRRFVTQIEHKLEEKMSRTLELNTIKVQALKELGYTEINENNAAEVFEKIAEIQSRKVSS